VASSEARQMVVHNLTTGKLIVVEVADHRLARRHFRKKLILHDFSVLTVAFTEVLDFLFLSFLHVLQAFFT
jgi:hypothetical protein